MRRPLSALAVLLSLLLLVSACGGSTATGSGGTSQQSPTAGSGQDAGTASPGTASQGTAAAGACPTANTTSLAKTKFVAHAGLAFGAFHRYLYKPYRAGTFKKGAKGRIRAGLKAGAAALFIKRELRLANEDVKASPALCKAISAPLANLSDTVQSAVDSLKNGDASGLLAANKAIDGIKGKAKSSGINVPEDETGLG